MNIRRIVNLFAGIACFTLFQGSISLAADAPASPPVASKEQREQMAKAHEKTAACLRSTRAVAECQQEMMHMCTTVMGAQGCGTMGGGMMHGNMMQGQPSKATPPTEPKKP